MIHLVLEQFFGNQCDRSILLKSTRREGINMTAINNEMGEYNNHEHQKIIICYEQEDKG